MTVSLPPDFDPNAEAMSDGVFGLPTTAEDAALVLVPVPWEATVSYRSGTSLAPSAILAASRQVELYDKEFGNPYLSGIAMVATDPRLVELHHRAQAAVLAKEPTTADNLSAAMNRLVEELTVRWREQGKIVGILGGDHSVPWGAIKALAREHPGLAVLQIDAHADLRSSYQGHEYSHACIAANLLDKLPDISRIVQVAVRDYCESEARRMAQDRRVTTFLDDDLSQCTWADVVAALPEEVWISIDVDGLDPSLCPHTGTPVPGGLTWRQAVALLAELGRSGKRVVGFDLCEVSPGTVALGEEDAWDAVVGARLLYKLCGVTFKSHAC